MGSVRYDKISGSGRSANTNRNHEYDLGLCKVYFSNKVIRRWNSILNYVVSANTLTVSKAHGIMG